MTIDSGYTDIYTNTERKTAPLAISAAMATAKRGNLNPNQAKKASEDFESVFLSQMLSTMFPDDSEPNEMFGSQEGDEVFRGMMVDEYAKQITKSGGIGIAGYIQRELLGQQEVAKGKPSPLKMFSMDAPARDAPLDAQNTSAVADLKATDAVAAAKAAKQYSEVDQIVHDIFEGGNSL